MKRIDSILFNLKILLFFHIIYLSALLIYLSLLLNFTFDELTVQLNFSPHHHFNNNTDYFVKSQEKQDLEICT